MSAHILKLWKLPKFKTISINSKLLFIYLISNPYLNLIGVYNLEFEFICLHTGLNEEELKNSIEELTLSNLIIVKEYNNLNYFIIPFCFDNIYDKQKSNDKIKSNLNSLPKELVDYLDSININDKLKIKNYKLPDPIEVTEFALSLGYSINGKTFIDFYKKQGEIKGFKDVLLDSKGSVVKNWKMKLTKVWCKKDNTIILPDNAPKGYEYLHIIVNNTVYVPDNWVNGYPKSKDFLITKELCKEYERRAKSS